VVVSYALEPGGRNVNQLVTSPAAITITG
jgi:hypothetical protein